jgi:oligosaccharide repeat unit polymerase
MACSFFIWIYHSERKEFDRKVLCVLGAGLLCGLSYFLAVGGLYGKLATLASPAFQYSTISKNSQLGLRALDPYAYATGSFPTFQVAIDDVDRFTWGTQSIYPLSRILYGLGVLQRKPYAVDFTFYFVPIPFNNYTWLFTFYSDFGVCGVLLLPGIVGWFETRLYVRMKEAPTLFSLAGSSALAAATAFTVSGFVQYDFILWYFLVVMLLVSKRVCSRQKGSIRVPAVRELEHWTAVRPI